MNHKFSFKKAQGQVLIDDKTKARRTALIQTLPDGDYEIIIRKAVKWDVAKMRKYFHGPVLSFIVEQFKVTGNVYDKNTIKGWLKRTYGLTRYDANLTAHMPKSMSEYTFETYTKFLNDINAWSIECFGYELPPSDEVE